MPDRLFRGRRHSWGCRGCHNPRCGGRRQAAAVEVMAEIALADEPVSLTGPAGACSAGALIKPVAGT
jgi:hypothetical protein